MENLELPQDIIWDGGQSPTLSPAYYSNASVDEILIFEDSFANELIQDDDIIKPNQNIEFSPEEFEQLLEIQEELLDNMIIEEPDNDQWLDQPIIQMDEYVPVQAARIYPVKVNTNQLINEFNQVLDSVELTHLTPPETPPHTPPQAPYEACLQDSKNLFYSQPNTNYQLQLNQQYQQCKLEEKPLNNYSPVIQNQQFPTIFEQAFNIVSQTTSQYGYADNSFDAEMAQVDALVRERAEDFADSSSIDDESSKCYSPRSETSSNSFSETSSINTDDSEWTMQSSVTIGTALKAKQTKQKRKPRTNRRSPEDRQSRKKEQNKSAANRYRMKKKAEVEILLDEEDILRKRNDVLQSQYADVGREVKYIKSLLRELFKAKGLIN